MLPFLTSLVTLTDGRQVKLTNPLTDLRVCHDGTPRESRILYFCQDDENEFVVKIKIQAPDSVEAAGPSTTTQLEVTALQMFKDAALSTVPHLVSLEKTRQPSNGPLPDGYITYTVMTKMPGTNLLDYKYWSRGFEERADLKQRFLEVLKGIWKVGVVPTDRALRNVLWEPETKTMSIVDFESWERPSGLAMDEEKELQAWGLAQRPPPGTWIDEWRLQYH